jgi:hypothetical protein
MRLFGGHQNVRVYPEQGRKGAVPTPPEPRRKTMNARLQGFLNFLDLLAEGQRRQAESIAGRRFHFEPELQPVTTAKVVKFPLTGNQKAHLFEAARTSKVRVEH